MPSSAEPATASAAITTVAKPIRTHVLDLVAYDSSLKRAMLGGKTNLPSTINSTILAVEEYAFAGIYVADSSGARPKTWHFLDPLAHR